MQGVIFRENSRNILTIFRENFSRMTEVVIFRETRK